MVFYFTCYTQQQKAFRVFRVANLILFFCISVVYFHWSKFLDKLRYVINFYNYYSCINFFSWKFPLIILLVIHLPLVPCLTITFFGNENFFLEIYGPLLQIGFNCLKATKPLQGDNLLLTTKSPEVRGSHLIELRRKKG